MKTVLAHKIRLYPNKDQDIFFRKACGSARVAYNYGLQRYKEILDRGEKPKVSEIKKEFNSKKRELFPWIYETNKDANQQPFSNLSASLTNFFKHRAKFPRFKKKGKHDSFYISNDKFEIGELKVRIPRLGWVRSAEALRFRGKVQSAVVSRTASYWFVSVSVETDFNAKTCENQEVVGVDLGIHALATLSTGKRLEPRNPLRKLFAKVQRLHRVLSRSRKGSRNRYKARMRLAKLYYVISCIRKDAIDKLTTYLCKNFKVICIEDLNVRGMLANHKLAKAISDLGFYEFRRQLEYKSILYGNTLIVVPRFFPSSKTCCKCGWKHEGLTLSDRTFRCEHCCLVIDRDLNAALNLRNHGLKTLGEALPEVTPVEMEALVLDVPWYLRTKLPSSKQEFRSVYKRTLRK